MGEKSQMNRLLIILPLLVMSALARTAEAQDIIKPFGGLEWDDSFTSATAKILSLPGLERCEASCVMGKIDILHMRNPSELALVPYKVMKASMILLKRETYVEEATGKAWPFESGPHRIIITAYPVMIAGVPFTLGAEFELNPGLLLAKPSNAIREADGALIPVVIRSAGLSSNSKALALNGDAISSIISKKYFGGKPLGGTTSHKDSTGSYFLVAPSSSLYRIEYGATYGSGYSQALRKAYSNYQSEMAVKAGKGKPDSSGKL